MGYQHDWKRWGVLINVGTGSNLVPKWVLSDNEAHTYMETGWAHLAVTYDAPNRRVRFYVNGEPQSTVPVDATSFVKVDPANPNPPVLYAGAGTTIADPGGDLLIGRLTWAGIATDYWKGSVRDVRAFTGVAQHECDSFAPTCIEHLLAG